MLSVLHDLRYALRTLRKDLAFTLIAVVTLAIGIGANTSMFSVINAVLLRPLPYTEADRLVWLSEQHDEIATRWISYQNFLDWRARNQSFEAIAAIRGWQMTLTGAGEAQSVNTRMVTGDYFRVMRATPQLGRDFTAEEDRFGGPPVTVLSHAFWQSQFGSDPSIIGRAITLDGLPFTVIGVMPADFQHQGPPALWVLMGRYAEGGWLVRDNRMAGFGIARLKAGVSLAQARADMKSIEEQLIREHPMRNGGNRIRVISLQDSIVGDSRQSILLLFAAVSLVLLIACANVANLLLARAATRKREFAVRAALGASRLRLLRLSLIESLVLSLLGCALGLLLARWGIDLLLQFAPESLTRLSGATLGSGVLTFSVLVSLLTGLIFGSVPAWQSSKADLQVALKEGSKTTADARTGRFRSVFVIAEFALAMVLLVGAGLLIKSLARILESDAGFEPGGIVTMELLPRQAYPKRPQLMQFYLQLDERLRSLPGVESIALLNDIPGFEPSWQTDINPEVGGKYQSIAPGELINVDWGIVSADYFRTFRIPIRQGRSFTAAEGESGSPVMIVDEHLARRFWPDGNAVGQHIKYDSATPIEIIGVAANVRNYGVEAFGRMKIYAPFGRSPIPRVTLAVRSQNPHSDAALSLVASIKREVQSINPNVPIYEVDLLDAQLARHIGPRTFNTWILGLFAFIALVLAAVGIYGVMSYTVAQRSHELGIRVALGAKKADVVRIVLTYCLKLSGLGLFGGVIGALLVTRWLKTQLYGVSPMDPIILISIALLLMVVALMACYFPARRASRVDPIETLRNE
jgi:putative ABC transport system permease protein